MAFNVVFYIPMANLTRFHSFTSETTPVSLRKFGSEQTHSIRTKTGDAILTKQRKNDGLARKDSIQRSYPSIYKRFSTLLSESSDAADHTLLSTLLTHSEPLCIT